MVAPLVVPRDQVAHAFGVEVVGSVRLPQMHLPAAVLWNGRDPERQRIARVEPLMGRLKPWTGVGVVAQQSADGGGLHAVRCADAPWSCTALIVVQKARRIGGEPVAVDATAEK